MQHLHTVTATYSGCGIAHRNDNIYIPQNTIFLTELFNMMVHCKITLYVVKIKLITETSLYIRKLSILQLLQRLFYYN